MKKYVKASLTSGLIGIWWIYNDIVIADPLPLDSGYNDGNFINYDEFKNHSTEWRRLIKEYLPNEADKMIPKGFKSLHRGRVIYNLRTQCYEVICGEDVFNSPEMRKMLVDAFDLNNCRYDFVNLGTHYHLAELMGNPALDAFEYGI